MAFKLMDYVYDVRISFMKLSRKRSSVMMIRKFVRGALHIFLWIDYKTSNTVSKKGYDSLQFNTDKVFCMAHYSKSSKLDPFDSEIFRCAKEMGFATLLFTNQSGIRSPHVDQVFKKPPRGRDAAVLAVLAKCLSTLTKFSDIEIWFVNNSIAWDQNGISTFYDHLKSVSMNTIVFPTQSNYPMLHVQPYFIFARLDTKGVKKFSAEFDWVKATKFKRTIVAFYEYKIANILQQTGWNIEVMCDLKHSYDLLRLDDQSLSYDDFLKIDFNPSSDIWKKLKLVNIPCVKKRILQDFAKSPISD